MTATEPIQAPTVVELEPGSGRLINSWGAGLFLVPHSVTVDSHDNVWLGDVGRHQIFKFTHDGRLLLTVGERRVPGWDGSHFNEPADVTVLDDGSFYVSDGYVNSRVAHFAADGRFLNEWGAKGNAPGQFLIPHGIARDASGRVYVADRQNSRLQVFNSTGKFLKAWPGFPRTGRIFDVAISPTGRIYLASTDGSDAVVVLDAELNQIEHIPFDSTRVTTAHQIAVQGDTVIYLADTGGNRILKFVRQ